MVPSVLEIGFRIHLLPCFGRLVCCSTPSLSLYASLGLLACPHSQPLLLYGPSLRVQHWELCSQFSSEGSILCPSPVLQGQFSIPRPPPDAYVRLQFTVYGFQFCWGVGTLVCRGTVLDYFSRVGWGVLWVHNTHLFLLQFHAGSFVASWWGEMALVAV
jgi:hypothetical protein